PVDQAQREEILAPVGVAGGEPGRGDGLAVEGRDRHADEAVAAQRAVVERVGGVPGLLQVRAGEGVRIDDQDAARLQVAEVGPQGGRVHGDQRVELVAGRVDVVAGEVDLEPGHAGQRPGRGADLGGEVGQGADVVAENGRGVG